MEGEGPALDTSVVHTQATAPDVVHTPEDTAVKERIERLEQFALARKAIIAAGSSDFDQRAVLAQVDGMISDEVARGQAQRFVEGYARKHEAVQEVIRERSSDGELIGGRLFRDIAGEVAQGRVAVEATDITVHVQTSTRQDYNNILKGAGVRVIQNSMVKEGDEGGLWLRNYVVPGAAEHGLMAVGLDGVNSDDIRGHERMHAEIELWSQSGRFTSERVFQENAQVQLEPLAGLPGSDQLGSLGQLRYAAANLERGYSDSDVTNEVLARAAGKSGGTLDDQLDGEIMQSSYSPFAEIQEAYDKYERQLSKDYDTQISEIQSARSGAMPQSELEESMNKIEGLQRQRAASLDVAKRTYRQWERNAQREYRQRIVNAAQSFNGVASHYGGDHELAIGMLLAFPLSDWPQLKEEIVAHGNTHLVES